MLKYKKTVGTSFPNATDLVRVQYDFTKDGGAIADYDVIEAFTATAGKFEMVF